MADGLFRKVHQKLCPPILTTALGSPAAPDLQTQAVYCPPDTACCGSHVQSEQKMALVYYQSLCSSKDGSNIEEYDGMEKPETSCSISSHSSGHIYLLF